MAGNWMDDRERAIRERDGRGLGDSPRASRDEDRTWDSIGERDDEVFGVRQSGVSYGNAGKRPYREGSAARGWQDPNYGGVSPAMREGGGYGRGRFQGGDYAAQDYRTGGGRFYGDDSRGRIYREEYGQGGVEYGDVPQGYDAGRYDDGAYSPTRARYHDEGYGRSGYGGYPGEFRREMNYPASGGTGGYDYERGYGDGGPRDSRLGESRGDRFEGAGRSAGAFLHRAGEKVASWFNAGGEGRIYDRDYLDPTPTTWRRGARGLGPQGYKRSDERISDEAHERLTDDTWLDASNIGISVSGGEITLSGTVESREAKHRAEHLVEDLSGVTHVQNNLRIAKGNPLTTPGRGYGDSVLGAQIRAADATPDDPAANGTGGAGGGQSTAGRKN
ncbi:BON domain-containing protein [Phenylobacterium sp.]|uniref:BON domain-containing protein n=1 Tax=Phenylobacterium sp. TaxID=1871053 RepID=UPI002C081371|nr:BON domain-containing protein [Phenylobacterium sp.]HLZ77568.1 BON domain-containing protein [Phenylobacterium sp.]